MNLPNKLTVLRIILVPFFVFFLLAKFVDNNYLFALILFILASITDHLDGKIARKTGQVTNFGKFLDPLADKILVISAFICFVELGFLGAVPVVVMLAREFLVTSVRLMAASNAKVIAANIWGKLKTVSQILAISIILVVKHIIVTYNLFSFNNLFVVLTNMLVWMSVFFSLLSGYFYVKNNANLIKN